MENQHPIYNSLGEESERGGEGFQVVQYEVKADEAPQDVTMKQPSTKIQQENKGNNDITVSYQARMEGTEEGVMIQTILDANKKQEPSFVVAESRSCTKTPKGGNCQQTNCHLDEVDESNSWGGKRKASNETVVPTEGGMPERENVEGLPEDEEGLPGLCSKRRAWEEMEETNGNHESSRNQDWTKKMPVKQQFVSWGECYICSECGRTFNNLPDFQTHETSHAGINLYRCAKCNKGFHSLELLKEHRTIHAPNQNYKPMEGNFFKPRIMKNHQEAQNRQQGRSAKNHSTERTDPSHFPSQPPVYLSCRCSPNLLIPVVQGNKPPMCSSCHSSLFVPHSNISSPSLDFPAAHNPTGSVSPFLSPSQRPFSKSQWMMGQKVASSQALPRPSSNGPWNMEQEVVSTQILPGQEVTSAHSLSGQCEDKVDDAPKDLTTKHPSTEIQQENKENKDATVLGMATEEEVTIQTTPDADKIQEPSSLVAESGSCTETPKGGNYRQKNHHQNETDEHLLWGGKRKALDPAVAPTGDMPESENDKGAHGLCPKRMTPGEMKETSGDQDSSGKQEENWIKKKPFEKEFSTRDECYICTECGKSFNNLPDFETHQTTHLGPCFYGCAVCGKIFPSQETLTEHHKIHTTNQNNKAMEGDFSKPLMMKSLQEAQNRQQASSAKNHSTERTHPPHFPSQPPVYLSCRCSPNLLIPVVQGNQPTMCPSCHSSLLAPHSNISSPSLDFPAAHNPTGSVSSFLSPSQRSASEGQGMMGQKMVSIQVSPRRELTSAYSLAGQCENKADEAPENLTTKQSSTEIHQENKDATVLDQEGMDTEEGIMIQTTLDASKKEELSSLIAESENCTKTTKGGKCQQKTRHLDEVDESVPWGEKRKNPDKVMPGDLAKRENDKGGYGLCLNRMAPEERKETNGDQDGSGMQEKDWIKKPFEKGFSTWDKCYICSECGKSFNSLPDFEAHQTTHLGACLYGCAVCGKIFHSQVTLTEHLIIHTVDLPSTSRKEDFFKPWMIKSLQEAQDRQQASNARKQYPEKTELPNSLSQLPMHLSCPCSPNLLIPVVQGKKPTMCPSCHSSLFVPQSYISSPSLYFPPAHNPTRSVSPFLSPSQKPSSEEQWKMASSQVFPGLSSNGPWKNGQKVVSTQLLPGREVTSAHSLAGQLERPGSPFPTHGQEFPQRSNKEVWNYPCIECEQNFDNVAKLKLHRHECKRPESFRCFLCNKGFSDMLSLDEHEESHVTASP